MKTDFSLIKKLLFTLIIVFISISGRSQEHEDEKSFWENVRFGGGLGLSAGNGNFYGSIAPSAVYDFNKYFSAGIGLQGSYANGDNFTATTYGGSLLGFFNPIPQVRLSSEFELLQVNIKREYIGSSPVEDSYAYPALFLGAGYRSGPVVAGVRYDVLYNEEKSIYTSPFMPFISIYF